LFISTKLSYNLVLLILISEKDEGKYFLTLQEHKTFFVLLSYLSNMQSSWQTVLLLSTKSFCLSFNIISVPSLEVVK